MQVGHWNIVDNYLYYDKEQLSDITVFITLWKKDTIYNEGKSYDEFYEPNYQKVLEFIFWYKDNITGEELMDLLNILQLYFKDTTENNLLII